MTNINRRQFLGTSAAVGTAAAATTTGLAGAAGVFWTRPAFAEALPDPASVLADIKVSKYVNADYRKLYNLSDDKPLWDPKKDWIRTVDWEAVRTALAGTTVRFAIGAADQDSAADGLKPFSQLSGIKVELVPIPDDSMYDKVTAEFISGNASFDALQFFSPWMGDFAGPGFLKPLDDYAAKWKLPLDDFYDTYRLNYGYFNRQLFGIPFDCDIQMVHLRKGFAEKALGGPIDTWNSVKSYDDLLRLSKELNKVAPGVSGIGLMGGRGFWSTYTWEHVAAQAGMELFDDQWNPIFNNDAGIKGLEIIQALSKNAIEGYAGAGWPENRAAWLGGQVATNISWQDSGTQAMRPDQSKIVDDFVTIYEPRIEGGRFAPPNIAGSTSCVAASSQNPEGAFIMLGFLTSASIMAMNEANANGVAPGYRSVLTNPNLRAASQPLDVWAKSLDYAWCAPRLPGMFEMEQAIGNELNKVLVGQASPKQALDASAATVKQIMKKNGFYGPKPPVAFSAAAPGMWVGQGKKLPA